MKNGGHVKGYLLNEETMDEVDKGLKELADKEVFAKNMTLITKKYYYLPWVMETIH